MADAVDDLPADDAPADAAGFITFYGIYWHRKHVSWGTDTLFGQPRGWTGKGKIAADFDRSKLQMNFWGQKGVYILYDSSLEPVYAGQAGLKKAKSDQDAGRTLGARLNDHAAGRYRNGWELFSWFGFLETPKLELKKASDDQRNKPDWKFAKKGDAELNLLLASFEAILIEGFSPRFNARGGDLKGATIVNQFEPKP